MQKRFIAVRRLREIDSTHTVLFFADGEVVVVSAKAPGEQMYIINYLLNNSNCIPWNLAVVCACVSETYDNFNHRASQWTEITFRLHLIGRKLLEQHWHLEVREYFKWIFVTTSWTCIQYIAVYPAIIPYTPTFCCREIEKSISKSR